MKILLLLLLAFTSFQDQVKEAIEKKQPLVLTSDTDLSDISTPIIVSAPLTIIGNHTTITGPSSEIALFELHSGASITCRDISFKKFGRVFNCNVNNKPFDIDIRDCTADNIGSSIIGSGAGVYCKFGSIRIQDCILTNMGQTIGHPKAYAIDLSISECINVHISDITIDGVSSLQHTSEVGGIRVDCSPSRNKEQPVLITNCIISDISSGSSTGTDQVVGIIALECASTISNCILDTIVAPKHTSSPEAIYTKCTKSLVIGNKILDVIGTEGCINLKGEFSGPSSAERSLISNNVISFRKPPTGKQCTGIACSAPNITVTGNLIEGTQVGVISGFNGTIVSGNTFRNLGSTAVELIPNGKNYNYTITNNIVENSTYGILATCAGTSSIESLVASSNVFTDTRFGLQVLHLSSTDLGSIQSSSNTFNKGKAALVVISDRFRPIKSLEVTSNTFRSINPLVTNTNNTTTNISFNSLDGKPWQLAQLDLQAVIDSAQGICHIPPGIYKVSDSIRIPTNLSIIGNPGVVIEHTPNVTSDLFVVDYPPKKGSYNKLGYISNLHCIGNKHSRYGIDLLKPQGLIIDHCTFDNFNGAGIRLRSAINTTIQNTNCNMSKGVSIDLGEQVDFIGTTVLVKNCYLRQGDWAATLAPASWYSVVFDSCIFESTNKGIIDIGTGCPGVTLSNCYSENIDGTSMIRVGATGTDKASFAGKASVLVDGGVYAASYDNSSKRLFIESDASRSTIAQNCPVTNCNAGLLSTTVFSQDSILTNVTTPQQEQENFGKIFDWKRVVATSIGNDLNPKGLRHSTATQLLDVSDISTTTTLDLPPGIRILGVSFYIRHPGITPKTWSASLVGESNIPLLSGVKGGSNTPAGILTDVVTTSTTNVQLKCDTGKFTKAQVQVAISYEAMHYNQEHTQ